MKNSIGLLIIVCMLSACTNKGVNKFSDPILVEIADLQDRRLPDSLYIYFKHKNPAYRKAAVLAFASVQDTFAIDQLGNVLRFDTDPEVRRNAAIALGQIRTKLSVTTLWKALQEEKSTVVLREIVESCGKTFNGIDIDQLVVASTDSLVKEGLAWAYYRLALRNKMDSAIALKSIEFLKPGYSLQTRLAASNFFMRSIQQIPVLAEAQLIEAAQYDKSPWVRAAVASALRKVKSAAALDALKKILKTDTDYRVRINAAKSLQEFPIADVKLNLYEALKDSNINVAIAASEVILVKATGAEANETASLANATTQMRVRGNLYEASLAGSDSAALVLQIIELYKSESDPYSKAALLTALGKSQETWRFIENELQQSTIPVIKSSAAAALVATNENPSFEPSLKKQYADAYMHAIKTGDAAVIGIVTGALLNPRLGYKDVITDYTFLYEAKKKLSLPKDNEALQPLEAAIAYFEGKKVDAVKNEFNHPIDWNLVKTIPRDQKVLIKTSKGDIVLKLLVEEAPGSVANFVQLVADKYFDAKNFHRVVPNFVIQGGCNRGDGWGSEDYSIRSEFTDRHYTEGSVGMASAGKDTEGTQWFITHSPTPHLDGRYSIFALTESGMDVVHQIEVGDKILSVTLIK